MKTKPKSYSRHYPFLIKEGGHIIHRCKSYDTATEKMRIYAERGRQNLSLDIQLKAK